jgi:hypothetical protein
LKMTNYEFNRSTPCEVAQMASATMIHGYFLGPEENSIRNKPSMNEVGMRKKYQDELYRFIAVCQAIVIIILTQTSTGTTSAVALLLPSIVRSIPLPI